MKTPETENDVKGLVRQWCDKHDAFHFAVVQNGMGTHGVHDRIAALPVTVTPEMVGKRIGVFLAIESKRPGRRGEARRGMSAHQALFMENVIKAGGLSICCDGEEDLLGLQYQLQRLTGEYHG